MAKVVLVKKANKKWRTCDNYVGLNKCLKDAYPLPQIDQLAVATTGFELLSFLKIHMNPEDDVEETSFYGGRHSIGRCVMPQDDVFWAKRCQCYLSTLD